MLAAVMAVVFAANLPEPLAVGASEAFLVNAPFSEGYAAVAEVLEADLVAAGYALRRIDYTALCAEGTLTDGGPRLLAVPDAAHLPMESAAPIQAFLRGGGQMAAFNTPAWRAPCVRWEQRWVPVSELRRQALGERPPHVFLIPSDDLVRTHWRDTARAAESGPSPLRLEQVAGVGPALDLSLIHI